MTVVVVGGGPAGVAAAIGCARGGASVVLLEGLAVGGEAINVEQMTELPGQPPVSGPDFAAALTEQVLASEVELRLVEEATAIVAAAGRWQVETSSGTLDADAVVYCAGAGPLPLPGRPSPLEDPLHGLGLSTCATCDGPLFAGGHVAIAGGGDTGVEAALTLSRYAARVILFERELSLTAQPALTRALEELGNVDVRMGVEVVGIAGAEQLEAAEVAEAGAEHAEPVDGLLLAVGLGPRTALLAGIVELDGRGAVVTDSSFASSAPGLFAAGDVRSGAAHRAAAAFGEGLAAARAVLAHVR